MKDTGWTHRSEQDALFVKHTRLHRAVETFIWLNAALAFGQGNVHAGIRDAAVDTNAGTGDARSFTKMCLVLAI